MRRTPRFAHSGCLLTRRSRVCRIVQQATSEGLLFDRIYFACGSGGTAAGLALGVHWSGLGQTTELVGLGVDDTPDEFYDKIDGIYRALGIGADEVRRLPLG